MRKAYDVYVNGSFREATNELSSYLVFLANTPEEIRRSRDVDALMYIAHEKLAYMMMVASNKNAACAQLRDAYKLHQRQMIKARFDLIPRTNFVESVVQGVEAVDAKTGVKWKSERPLNANVVREVNLLFLSPKNASSEPSMN